MTKFEPLAKALEIIHKINSEIRDIIEPDLKLAGYQEVTVNAWVHLFKKKEEMYIKYHEVCGLEMALTNARLFVEHHKAEEPRLGA